MLENTTPAAPKDSVIDDIRELLVDFGLPALVMVITGALIFTGRDGELKTVFAGAVGWLFKSGYTRKRK